jgi:hypothetical protein
MPMVGLATPMVGLATPMVGLATPTVVLTRALMTRVLRQFARVVAAPMEGA